MVWIMWLSKADNGIRKSSYLSGLNLNLKTKKENLCNFLQEEMRLLLMEDLFHIFQG